ncbi:hypothetical protein [Rhodococcoides yunnanense]|uniref:hypothetical protein n=1 Tax=Rhodococcoides yunnanense TaxID=278209 RepID=UPI0022B11CCC|nr:hypothetical protein [Rhodococcus yunnanensis]MCZ4277449.1 hypothetical protein [Rhodococcus yunnanensis]
MHEVTTHQSGTPVETAIMAAIAAVPEILRAQALDKIKFHTVQAELSRVAASSHEHAEEAAKWACIARENGASEHHITAAEQDGHHFIARFGDDGA